LEPLLERRGAGEWWKPLLKEQEGVGDDGDPQAPACKNISQAEPANMPAGIACRIKRKVLQGVPLKKLKERYQ
jgi:hypothetical protein